MQLYAILAYIIFPPKTFDTVDICGLQKTNCMLNIKENSFHSVFSVR